MFCHCCGGWRRADHKFCPKCGVSLASSSASQVSSFKKFVSQKSKERQTTFNSKSKKAKMDEFVTITIGIGRRVCHILLYPPWQPGPLSSFMISSRTTSISKDGNPLLKAGVNVKAVFTSLNTAFLPISRSRFKRRQIPMLITLSTIWQFCVNFWVIFRCFGKERFFLKG